MFVAFWLVPATKAADSDLAREQAALAAAEQLQESLQDLIDAFLWGSRAGDTEKLDRAIREWERLAALKIPALRRTPLGDPMTVTLWVVRDWFTWYKQERVGTTRDPHGNPPWGVEDFDRVWPPLSIWLTAVLAHLVTWREGKPLPSLPPKPRFGSPYDRQPGDEQQAE